MKLRFCILAASTLIATGCSSGPPATVDGSIKGQTFPALEAISGVVDENLGPMAVVVASTTQGTCDLFSANKITKNAQILIISLGNVNFAEKKLFAPNGPNTFPILDLSNPAPTISTDTIATVEILRVDATCQNLGAPIVAVSGSVTLSSAQDLVFEGTGDVTLNTGDHITFTFNSTPCNGLSTELKSDTPATCQ